MMNLKKLSVLGIASCALFATGCQRETSTKILSYNEAKVWVKNNYGEDEVDFVAPKSSSSEWALDGYLADAAGQHDTAYKYLVEHTVNFLAGYSYVKSSTVEKTSIPSGKLGLDEIGYVTDSPIINEISFTSDNFTYPMRLNNFDEVLDSTAYRGVSKYNCEYLVNNSDKTLTINGTFDFTREEIGGDYRGYHIFHLAGCSIKFNKKGYLESIKFNINQDTEARYNWYNITTPSYSSTVSGIFLKGSFIHFNYIY